jgi:hypothetical protein
MVNYTCKVCEKIWTQKHNYLQHLNRKKPCSSDIDKLKLHIDKLNVCIKKLQSDNHKLKTELAICRNMDDSSTKILPDFEPHGYEIFDNILSENEILQIFSYGPKMFDQFIERIYFNEKHTEHQNIYISNLSKKLVRYNKKKGCSWISDKSNIVLGELKNTVLDFIKSRHELLCDEIDDDEFDESIDNPLKTKKYTINIVQKMEDILRRYDDAPENNKYFIDKIIHILYNNKKIPMTSIKKYREQQKIKTKSDL